MLRRTIISLFASVMVGVAHFLSAAATARPRVDLRQRERCSRSRRKERQVKEEVPLIKRIARDSEMGTARALNQNSLRVSRIDASPAPHSRDEVDEEPNTRWNRLAWQERGEKLDAVTPKIRQAFDKHPRCKAEPCPYRKLNPVGY